MLTSTRQKSQTGADQNGEPDQIVKDVLSATKLCLLQQASCCRWTHLHQFATVLRALDPNAFYLGANKWPIWKDVYSEGNIAVYITDALSGGYSLPAPRSQLYLVRWAASHGRLIDEMEKPIDDPWVLKPKLLARFADNQANRDLRLAEQQIDAAIDKMLGGLKGPTRWNENLQCYELAK